MNDLTFQNGTSNDLRSQIATASLPDNQEDGDWKSQNVISNLPENHDDESLRSQIVTIKKGRGEHKKYMPYAFTELGVAMLSSGFV